MALLLIALPWITLFYVRKFKAALTVDGSRPSAIASGVLLPGIGLTLCIVYDTSPVHWQGPTVATLLGAALLGYRVVRADPGFSMRAGGLAVSALIAGYYGYGAGMLINTSLDFRAPEIYPAKILDKRIANTKGHARYLTFEPWGPKTANNQLHVSNSLYDEINIGDTACIGLHRGALGIAWYALANCHENDAPRSDAYPP